jgi:hypothetical protein
MEPVYVGKQLLGRPEFKSLARLQERRKDVVWISWESRVPETTLARCARSVRMRSGREFLGAEYSKLYGGGIDVAGKKLIGIYARVRV